MSKQIIGPNDEDEDEVDEWDAPLPSHSEDEDEIANQLGGPHCTYPGYT